MELCPTCRRPMYSPRDGDNRYGECAACYAVTEREANSPHVVTRMRCRRCWHECLSVHPVGTDTSRLECSKCGAQDSHTTPVPHADTNAARRIREEANG